MPRRWTARDTRAGDTISPESVQQELSSSQSSITTLDRDQIPANAIDESYLEDYAMQRVWASRQFPTTANRGGEQAAARDSDVPLNQFLAITYQVFPGSWFECGSATLTGFKGGSLQIEWSGNVGNGTASFRSYRRHHQITAVGRPPIEGSSDRVFHGDADRWNPEQLLIAALSQCHMLSYLWVAAANGIVVEAYRDEASGTLQVESDGSGRMTSVALRPQVEISSGDADAARSLHGEAARLCFIGASDAFPVTHDSTIVVVS